MTNEIQSELAKLSELCEAARIEAQADAKRINELKAEAEALAKAAKSAEDAGIKASAEAALNGESIKASREATKARSEADQAKALAEAAPDAARGRSNRRIQDIRAKLGELQAQLSTNAEAEKALALSELAPIVDRLRKAIGPEKAASSLAQLCGIRIDSDSVLTNDRSSILQCGADIGGTLKDGDRRIDVCANVVRNVSAKLAAIEGQVTQ